MTILRPGTCPPSAGGATDGVGSVLFGGSDLVVPFDNNRVFTSFIHEDDPPRAPIREDLMVLDPDDNTKMNIVRSGLYDLSLNAPLRLDDVDFTDVGFPGTLQADVQIWINGGNEPPAYDWNNRAYWDLVDADSQHNPIALNLAFPQVLLAGDVLQLGFKATWFGGGTLGGTLHLHPDITFVLNYRGPVA